MASVGRKRPPDHTFAQSILGPVGFAEVLKIKTTWKMELQIYLPR